MKYDFAIVVGRFQPYQNAHHKLVNYALSLGNKVIIVLGSSHSTRTTKNPFTAQEREIMIRACFTEEIQKRLNFAHVRDYPYNENLWIAEVQNIANQYIASVEDATLALVGHFKDESSYYLNLFPQWKLEHFEAVNHNKSTLNATAVRELYFTVKNTRGTGEDWEELYSQVPEAVFKYLVENCGSDDYVSLKREHEYNKKYKEDSKFVGLPFPPTFVTTDTVVTALGHVLVVRRGFHPGKGLLALPGGFLAQNITLEENAIKELREETGIKVPKEILKSNIVSSKVFDHPYRSLRGRTITHAFHVELTPNLEDGLPKVKGGDDAASAKWVSISDILQMEDEFFEDHYDLIRWAIGV